MWISKEKWQAVQEQLAVIDTLARVFAEDEFEDREDRLSNLPFRIFKGVTMPVQGGMRFVTASQVLDGLLEDHSRVAHWVPGSSGKVELRKKEPS